MIKRKQDDVNFYQNAKLQFTHLGTAIVCDQGTSEPHG